MNRRGFLAGCLAVGIAPAVGRAEWLMHGRGERWVMHGGVFVPHWATQPCIVTFNLPSPLREFEYQEKWLGLVDSTRSFNVPYYSGSGRFGQRVFVPTFRRDQRGRHIYESAGSQ